MRAYFYYSVHNNREKNYVPNRGGASCVGAFATFQFDIRVTCDDTQLRPVIKAQNQFVSILLNDDFQECSRPKRKKGLRWRNLVALGIRRDVVRHE